MNLRDVKDLKKKIQEEGALYMGYRTTIVGDILNELGDDFLTRVLGSEFGEAIVEEARKGRSVEAINIFVSEAVRQMTYSEFKCIAHNFFSYHKEEKEVLAQTLEATEVFYEKLSSEPEYFLGKSNIALFSTQCLVEQIKALPIIDVCWDVTNPELRGLPVKEIPEHKKEYVSSTLGEVLSGFDYALLTGQEYKERFAEELKQEDYIEPWSAEQGHSYYPIEALPDDFMVLLDLAEPVQPFYWGRNYKEVLNEMHTLTPFGDISGNRQPYEDGWDREVDFEALGNILEEQFKGGLQRIENLQEEIVSFEENFKAVLEETAFYLPLEQAAFACLTVLTDEQLEEVLEAQEHQLQDTREGIDQAAYEILEEGADIADIDDWVKDFKVGVLNLKYILSEQRYRVEQKKSQGKKAKCK
ncbi:hypothetical protein [Lactococcus petauri]|uniref:hypothetical protein n=1 Tax=Lactococcus petauri TaxID=1940789 RepID=UPI001F590AF3|nr:hypothetical protein [Lactococcus petauri]